MTNKECFCSDFRRASSNSNAYSSAGGKETPEPAGMTSPRTSNLSRPESVIEKLRIESSDDGAGVGKIILNKLSLLDIMGFKITTYNYYREYLFLLEFF